VFLSTKVNSHTFSDWQSRDLALIRPMSSPARQCFLLLQAQRRAQSDTLCYYIICHFSLSSCHLGCCLVPMEINFDKITEIHTNNLYCKQLFKHFEVITSLIQLYRALATVCDQHNTLFFLNFVHRLTFIMMPDVSAKYTDRWWAFVNAVTNLRVP